MYHHVAGRYNPVGVTDGQEACCGIVNVWLETSMWRFLGSSIAWHERSKVEPNLNKLFLKNGGKLRDV